TASIVEALDRGASQRPRPSLVYVLARAPDAPSAALTASLRKLMRRGIAIRWISTPQEAALSVDGDDDVRRAVTEAVTLRARVARERGERVLGSVGVRVVRGQRRKAS